MPTDPFPVFRRWGLTTLGDLAALPAAALSARLGQAGLAWQHLARGGDPAQPMVPWTGDERFQASLELEWPIEGLEPLSFVLSRLLDPLAADLARRDRAAAVLHLRLGLVTRAVFTRSLRLPAPIRDPGVLRTLMRLDLESHPPGAGIETVAIDIEPAPGPIVQESLLERARPAPEQITTLMARLAALVGDTRCGAPALVDSNRPGAFAMTAFGAQAMVSRPTSDVPRPTSSVSVRRPTSDVSSPEPRAPSSETLPGVLRRFRRPIPVRVGVEQGCPVQVTIDRPDLRGGPVERCAGPWRTSGEWWRACGSREAPEGKEAEPSRRARARGGGAPRALNNADPPWVRDGAPQRQERLRPCESEAMESRRRASASVRGGGGAPPQLNNADPPWDRDEWDIALASGLVCRLFRERDTQGWFIDALMD